MVAAGPVRKTPGTWVGHEGTAEEMARAILFLAADESGFLVGVDIPVDGGRILGPHGADM
jgi:NAD(P)-dependent dehydrogenase (short-subunit alcohol dehydrogenase family)